VLEQYGMQASTRKQLSCFTKMYFELSNHSLTSQRSRRRRRPFNVHKSPPVGDSWHERASGLDRRIFNTVDGMYVRLTAGNSTSIPVQCDSSPHRHSL